MKIVSIKGSIEELDFTRIENELVQLAKDKSRYFNESDLYCIIKDVENELKSKIGDNKIISYWELRNIIRRAIEKNNFKSIVKI